MNETSSWCMRNREVMPPEAAPCALDLPARLAQHNPRWTDKDGPIGYWTAGVPIGNGDFGALVYGPPENLTLLLGKNDLWIRNNNRSNFPPGTYADLLKMYRAGDRAAFEALLPKDPHWADRFRPDTNTNGGFFRLSLAEGSATNQFLQELCLYDATWRASFEGSGLDNMWAVAPDFQLDAFASAPDEVVALRIRRHRLPLRSMTWRLGREKHELLPEPRVGKEGPVAWIQQDLLKGDRYAVAVCQAGLEPQLTLARRSAVGETSTDSEHEVIFYLAVASHRDADDPRELACERVLSARQKGWEALHDEHRRHWAVQWERSWVTCSNADVERPWYLSNYLCTSTLRPGKVSPGLQGMWIKENFPPWGADFHGNVNIQALYMGLMGANRMDYFEPCARLYHGMRPQCTRDARDYFDVGGARYPHAGGIDGHELCEPNWIPLAVSIGPSAWIARLFWWAYLHTLDRDFLAGTAYPILKDVALFYTGLLALAGKGPDGRYRLEPSIYSEYYATTFDAWGTDALYDIVNMRMAFQQAADAANALGQDTTLAQQWRTMQHDLSELPVDSEGGWTAFRKHPRNFRIGAGSWCYPIFPGEVADAFHGTPTEQEQARVTWASARNTTGSPWCAGCPTVAAARMGDTEWAIRTAAQLNRNGLSGTPSGGIMQAEHGTGMTLALNNMLAFAVDGRIVLFAGMPPAVDAAFHSLRVAGAVLVSAEQRAGSVTFAAFQALHGGLLRVLNPFGAGAENPVSVCVCESVSGKIVGRWQVPWREAVEWQAEPGTVYRMERDART